MDPVDTLIGLSEVSLALAGFAAIVLVLGTRDEPLDNEGLAIVRVMVSNAVGCAFMSLAAVAVLSLEISGPRAWTLLSGLALAGMVAGAAANFFLFLRHVEGRGAPRTLLTIFWWSFVVVSAVIHFVNAAGLLATPSFGLFFLGVVVLLNQAAVQFVYMVYVLLGRSSA